MTSGGWQSYGPWPSSPPTSISFSPLAFPASCAGTTGLAPTHAAASPLHRTPSSSALFASSLVRHPAWALLLCARSPLRDIMLFLTIGEIKQQDDDASLSAFEVDLSSFSSIKKFESGIKQWLLDSNLHPSIQLLINNAGILATSCRVTSDGYDQMMQTNFIGAFVLTNLLLPLLKISPVPSKIVNVTSFTHRCISNTDLNEGTLCGKIFDCLATSGSYPSAHTYELSKLCLLLFSYELHRQLHLVDPSPNISVIAADPGVVKTKIMREIPPIISELAFKALRIMRLLQSPETGVDSIIDAALAPSDASGEYFFGGRGRTIRSSKLSYNAQLGKNLWSRSMMLFEEVQSSFHFPLANKDEENYS